MPPLRISAIIPTFNRPAALRRTLQTVFALNPLPDELLIVDQSEHEDADLRDYIATAPPALTIHYWRRPPNAQSARNEAAARASGDILLFLDDDVLLERDLVADHLRNYEDRTVGAVGGFYLEPGEQPTREFPAHYFRKHTGWIYFPHAHVDRMETGLLPSCNGSIRRELLFHAGGFDEQFIRTLLDDTDLSCRLRAMGVRVIHDPTARAIHLKEPSGGKRPGGRNPFVIADSAAWQVWWYFFAINFGWRGWRDILVRFRSTVLRRVNLVRPWYLATAMYHFVHGGVRARAAIRAGRGLPLLARSPAPIPTEVECAS
jgi:GT2 family glycosyltransferase